MKVEKKEVLSKIEEIEDILVSDINLEKYINSIEKSKDLINAPNNFKDNILKKCKLDNKTKNKIKYIDIVKIAACTLFAVIIWEGALIQFKDLKTNIVNEQNEDKHENIIDQVNDEFRKISRQVVTPVENKKNKGDKK